MRTFADITVSLDGYVTAPGADIDHGLGVDGEALHNWVFNGDDIDEDVLALATGRSGAVVMGRTLFDVIDGPKGWNEEMGYGAKHATNPPFFVVTHRGRPDKVRLPHDFSFLPDPKSAIEAARSVAGDKDVVVMGGGSVIRQCVLDGLVDELSLHVSPIVFGGGTPLFTDGDRIELRQSAVRPSANAIHVTYTRA
ncbi:MAG: dihydrofolate reductase family protein [Acidimicrobiales bacterium]|nr:dihydrofolate reductase family protein [Acidimicrobiales bacterium]